MQCLQAWLEVDEFLASVCNVMDACREGIYTSAGCGGTKPKRSARSSSESMQVTLKLCTNIEPRHGGRLDVGSLLWKSGTAGRPWEYTGAASLLKSALQKNIRRGRAEEAVR